jgi:1A family penicillin-binding protein
MVKSRIRKIKKHFHLKNILSIGLGLFLIIFGMTLIWLTTLKIPSLESFKERKTTESTKIYDRTGKVLLYDIFEEQKRTIIPFEKISPLIKQATLSIEDKEFYSHKGIKPTAFLRAVLVNIFSLSFSQGGSTITKQAIKKTILTDDKTPTRKLKEWVLALKLEKIMTKDEIFSLYLNEIPYGGNIYGIEEASQTYFGKSAKDIDLAEAAYLASMPQAPSYYSPYGKHLDKLDERKNLVLREMVESGYITEEEYQKASKEKVVFLPKEDKGIKAPHFVMYVKDYLEKKYGEDVLTNGGLRVTATIDYDLQKKAEEIALKYALENKKNFNGENAAFVAIDPTNGNILTMVGSRDYFDKDIDGQFNVSTAHRQPGSTFKPFVYAEAFNKGYTPETVLFDVKTQFSTRCLVDDKTSDNGCYSPENYDNKFRGPMTLRDALAQSINIPAVKALYLAGISDSIDLAESMGITSLGDPNQYGLTLVLGGGEVTLLDMVSAYGVFASEGKKTPYNSILKIEDSKGNILEELKPKSIDVLNPESARKISDILSDNVARTPLYGANSALYFQDRDVAVKTGTTNDYKDAWIIGYTPNIVIGTWAGNNNNTPMEKKVAGLIVAPMWRALMQEALKTLPKVSFNKPLKEDSYALKPVLRGKWIGGLSNIYGTQEASSTNQDGIPYNSIQEVLTGGVHSILYWLNKDDPRGLNPVNPESDPQFKYWEYGVRKWALENNYN